MAIGRNKAVDLGKCRRLAFAEPRPEDSAFFDHGISALLDAFAQLRILRLGRRFQALTRRGEQTAVKCAAWAAILQPAEGKVCAAMCAMALDQAVTSLLIAKQY